MALQGYAGKHVSVSTRRKQVRVYLPRGTDVTGSLVLRMQAGSARLHYKGRLSLQGIPSGKGKHRLKGWLHQDDGRRRRGWKWVWMRLLGCHGHLRPAAAVNASMFYAFGLFMGCFPVTVGVDLWKRDHPLWDARWPALLQVHLDFPSPLLGISMDSRLTWPQSSLCVGYSKRAA